MCCDSWNYECTSEESSSTSTTRSSSVSEMVETIPQVNQRLPVEKLKISMRSSSESSPHPNKDAWVFDQTQLHPNPAMSKPRFMIQRLDSQILKTPKTSMESTQGQFYSFKKLASK